MESFVWQDVENAVRFGTATLDGRGIVLMSVLGKTVSFEIAEATRVREALDKAIARAKDRTKEPTKWTISRI